MGLPPSCQSRSAGESGSSGVAESYGTLSVTTRTLLERPRSSTAVSRVTPGAACQNSGSSGALRPR